MTTNITETYSSTDIAIVGLAGRFPGAESVDALWDNLKNGIESIQQYSEEQLRELGVAEDKIADPNFVPRSAILPDQDKFDAAFFGYSPREAEELDPQQRLFLETAWQALESAGYDSSKCDFPIGVYGGCGVNTYLIMNLMQSGRFNDLGNISSLQALMNGNNKDAMTMTLAYKLNLKGPAVTVQTACSTSLSAVHMATRGLLNYESDMVLAGGAWLNFLHQGGYVYQPGAILSADGHCRPFAADSQGTVIGSGSGVVVMKRLADALADGDTVHAVIKGSAMNNDGNTKAGYTAPSVDGQAQVIAAALEMADTPPDTIGYVEAHGTGTVIGDPIEIAALTQAYRLGTDKKQYCAVGSIKSNLGHLDAAAGVTGLIKTVLALKHGLIPASLHFEQANPEIDFANSPFYVADKLIPWVNDLGPRRAGVSSFGIGGTNVHVVLQEAPKQVPTKTQRSWQVLPLSAHTVTALTAQQAQFAQWLQQPDSANVWQDAAYTLQVGRKGFAHRSVVVAQTPAQAAQALEDELSMARVTGRLEANHQLSQEETRAVTFMFPGQGSQHVNMARSLYETEMTFRTEFDRCRDILKGHLGLDIAALIFVDEVSSAQASEQLQQTQLTQPLLFAVEYALAQQWLAWGVQPSAMIGHSIGEYVAACIAGVFSLEVALRIVAKRGQLIQAQPTGSMLSVALSEESLACYLETVQGVELAAVNSPENCVVSGSDGDISVLESCLVAAGVVVQSLHVSHAFHSSLVAEAADTLAQFIERMPRQVPRIAFISNVTGTWISNEQAIDPQYWAAHLTQAVRFSDGLRTIVNSSAALNGVANSLEQPILLEVGPSNTLSQLAGRDPVVKQNSHSVTSLPHPRKQAHTAEHFALALGRLWVAGAAINWHALYNDKQTPRRILLPSYPFERKRFWIDAKTNFAQQHSSSNGLSPMPFDKWCYIPSYKRALASVNSAQAFGCTLVLESEHQAGQLLAKKLHDFTETVIRVELGTEYQQKSATQFVIRPDEFSDHQQLIATVKQAYGGITNIFHLWSLSTDSLSFTQSQQRGMMSLLMLAQNLEQQQPQQAVNITVVSQNLLDVSGHDTVAAQQATLLGPCKVLPQEFPKVTCQVVDFGTHFNNQWVEWLVTEQQNNDGDLVAYRDRNRWTLEYLATPMPLQSKTVYRQGGVYLITGGLGGVGLVMAEHLAKNFQAKLVLIGRKLLSAEQQAKLTSLEAHGAKIFVKQVDVACASQMTVLLNEIEMKFGQVHGVIHAAGNGDTRLISSTDDAFVQSMFAAKVQGTQLLLSLFGKQNLDFMVLCSSLASIAGGLSKAAYASANAFLDAAAQHFAQLHPFPVISVNWDSWREVGMAADMVMPDGVGITPKQGVELMTRILSMPELCQLVVSTLDLEARLLATKGNMLNVDLAMESNTATTKNGYERPELSTPFIAPEDDLQIGIAEVWSHLLGIEQIGIHDNLFELGGDSLLGVQIMSQLSSKFVVELSPASFFKEPTILGLANVIEQVLLQELAEDITQGAV
ncbi:type I polyketide synthase [Pseudoalteromonas prydzensis]|uniref:SDR family NAD(P)-dependent oxidoreductase n=1 Tax=Pseudoalteromonas prydzensis TaxID=182141 RepID=A0ABR9FJQ7_9GAMM|nr:type I polyketide synthase [Pseudoalteromonas prydzensis]MBE0457051.1 SDR family NAD(P)-dependent oxidoreductase [Pseudoalteromonas prydzensis]